MQLPLEKKEDGLLLLAAIFLKLIKIYYKYYQNKTYLTNIWLAPRHHDGQSECGQSSSFQDERSQFDHTVQIPHEESLL